MDKRVRLAWHTNHNGLAEREDKNAAPEGQSASLESKQYIPYRSTDALLWTTFFALKYFFALEISIASND